MAALATVSVMVGKDVAIFTDCDEMDDPWAFGIGREFEIGF